MPEVSGARDWTLFLRDMQHFCAKVIRYTGGLDQPQVLSAEMTVDAVLRNLVRQRHPSVPWRRIAGLRDVLAHAYFGLEEETIWQTVSLSIPALAEQLTEVAAIELTANN